MGWYFEDSRVGEGMSGEERRVIVRITMLDDLNRTTGSVLSERIRLGSQVLNCTLEPGMLRFR